jgi:hypothetical protein
VVERGGEEWRGEKEEWWIRGLVKGEAGRGGGG